MASRKYKQYERKTFRGNNTLSLVYCVETTTPQCLDKWSVNCSMFSWIAPRESLNRKQQESTASTWATTVSTKQIRRSEYHESKSILMGEGITFSLSFQMQESHSACLKMYFWKPIRIGICQHAHELIGHLRPKSITNEASLLPKSITCADINAHKKLKYFFINAWNPRITTGLWQNLGRIHTWTVSKTHCSLPASEVLLADVLAFTPVGINQQLDKTH